MKTVIVETKESIELFLNQFKEHDSLVIPILSDSKTHPIVNPLCILSISIGDCLYLLGFNHNELLSLPFDVLEKLDTHKTVWTPDKKTLCHAVPGLSSDDVYSLEYLATGSVTFLYEFYTQVHIKMYEMYDRQVNINKSVPIMKHLEFLMTAHKHYWNVIDLHSHQSMSRSFKFLSDIAIPGLAFVEKPGLEIIESDAELKYGNRIKRYISDDKVYSEYNLYTTTGRCSNKFGGINFAALNKKDGTRNMFVSRFERGVLVLADFESFHLRLIADMIDYHFPTDIPVHEYLGRQYFNTNLLTQEQYEESKKITFKLLYGEDRDENVPEFFKQVYDYVDMLMVLLNRNGYIMSPYYKRDIKKERIEEPTPSKIFNYMVQLAETEINLTNVNKLKPLFENVKSKPVLYTYDSLLFDYCLDDGTELLKESIKILSNDNKFPMRVYYGSNYQDMKRFSI